MSWYSSYTIYQCTNRVFLQNTFNYFYRYTISYFEKQNFKNISKILLDKRKILFAIKNVIIGFRHLYSRSIAINSFQICFGFLKAIFSQYQYDVKIYFRITFDKKNKNRSFLMAFLSETCSYLEALYLNFRMQVKKDFISRTTAIKK